jgi:hypothetical protein
MTGDLPDTVIAKSDQLNADDLVGGPLTINVTAVSVKKGEDQPCVISYKGDNGKPYKPRKGMRRLLMMAWKTDDSQTFVGRSMTLWRNPNVTWAGQKVGGIQISHLSHMESEETFSIAVSRGVRDRITVKPLRTDDAPKQVTRDNVRQWLLDATTLDELRIAWTNKAAAPFRDELKGLLAEQKAALALPAETLTPDNPTASEGRTDEPPRDAFGLLPIKDDAAKSDDVPADERIAALVIVLIARFEAVTTRDELDSVAAEFLAESKGWPDEIYAKVKSSMTEAETRVDGNA